MGLASLQPCPCCGFSTYSASVATCSICWWEVIGIPLEDEDEICGGPNHGYSLRQARENFIRHGHMYDAGKPIRYLQDESDTRKDMMHYVRAVLAGRTELDQTQFLKLVRAEEETIRTPSKPYDRTDADEEERLFKVLMDDTGIFSSQVTSRQS